MESGEVLSPLAEVAPVVSPHVQIHSEVVHHEEHLVGETQGENHQQVFVGIVLFLGVHIGVPETDELVQEPVGKPWLHHRYQLGADNPGEGGEQQVESDPGETGLVGTRGRSPARMSSPLTTIM